MKSVEGSLHDTADLIIIQRPTKKEADTRAGDTMENRPHTIIIFELTFFFKKVT